MKSPLRRPLLLLTTVLLQAAAIAQWSSDAATNTAIVDSVGLQGAPLIVANGDGSTWIAWFESRNGVFELYAQRVDAQGNETFAHNGILVSNHPQNATIPRW